MRRSICVYCCIVWLSVALICRVVYWFALDMHIVVRVRLLVSARPVLCVCCLWRVCGDDSMCVVGLFLSVVRCCSMFDMCVAAAVCSVLFRIGCRIRIHVPHRCFVVVYACALWFDVFAMLYVYCCARFAMVARCVCGMLSWLLVVI